MEDNKKEIIEVEKVDEKLENEPKNKEIAEEKVKTEKTAETEAKNVEILKEKEQKQRSNTKDKEPKKDRKGYAITSMVLGIISLVLFFFFQISIPCAILAIIFGAMSVKSTKKGMAIAGLITGIIGLILIMIIFASVFFIALTTALTSGDCLDDYLYEHRRDYDYNYDSYDEYYDLDYYDNYSNYKFE